MWNKDDLLELLRRIRRITDGAPNFRAEYNRLAQLTPEDVRQAGSVVREIEAKSKQVTVALEAVARRHSATEQDREAIAEFVAAGMRSTVDFDELFASLSFIGTERFKRDQQVERTRRRVSRIQALRDEMMSWDMSAREFVISIAERAQELVERREQIFAEIRRLERISVVRASKAGDMPLRRIGTALERVNVVGDAGIKLFSAMGWIQRLIGGP